LVANLSRGLEETVEVLKGRRAGRNEPPGRFSDRVRSLRKRLGLTQKEFAACYSLKIGTVRNWEQDRGSGEAPDATASLLIRIIEENPESVAEIAKEEVVL